MYTAELYKRNSKAFIVTFTLCATSLAFCSQTSSVNVEWTRNVTLPGVCITSGRTQIQYVDKGNFVVAGYRAVEKEEHRCEVVVAKLDGHGRRIWQKVLATEIPLYTSLTLKKKGDDGFFILGYTYKKSKAAGKADESDLWKPCVFIIKINSTGKKMWQRYVTIGQGDFGSCIFPSHTKFSFCIFETSDHNRDTLRWFDLEGRKRSVTNFETKEGMPYCIKQANDNDSIIVGYMQQMLCILKLSKQGVVTWQHRIRGVLDSCGYLIDHGENGHIDCLLDHFPDVCSTVDNGFLLVNNIGVKQENSDKDNRDIAVLKLNAEGKIVWNQHYGGKETYEWGTTADETADGGFLIVGVQCTFLKKKGVELHYCLVKTDKAGNELCYTVLEKPCFDIRPKIISLGAGSFLIIAGTGTGFKVLKVNV